jgi:membrane protease YdiL (CAAX protease family)
MTTTDRRLGLIGTAFVLIVPVLGPARVLARGSGLGWDLAREALWWALCGLVLYYVLRVERRPLASIGLRTPTWRTFLIGIAASLVLIVASGLMFALLFPALGLSVNTKVLHRLGANPLWLQVMLAARAGVVEEVLFRGYAIERIREFTGSAPIAAALSLASFTIAHLAGWGWAQLLPVATAGLILTLLYLWRRDLLSNICAHALTDLAGFLAAAADHA